MSDLRFSRTVACGAARCRTLLLDPAFLAAFVDLQHPIGPRITVSAETASSVLAWTVATEGIPAIFARLVPKTVPIHLTIAVPEPAGTGGAISLDITGKPSGTLRASLQLAPAPGDAGTTVKVDGSFRIDLGLLSGRASGYLKDGLILPILEELADLLEQWATGPPTAG